MYISAGIKAIYEGKIYFTNIDENKKFYIQEFELEAINLKSSKIEQY
jgi:hypothetical protein